MKLSTGNKRKANKNGRKQRPRLKNKWQRKNENQLDGNNSFRDFERDTDVNRHSGIVIRDQGKAAYDGEPYDD